MSPVVRRDGFAMIPDWFTREAVPALGLKSTHIAAYNVIVGRADEHGECFPSYDRIAFEGGMTNNTAASAVKGLLHARFTDADGSVVECPLIEIVSEGNGTAHRYRVLPRPANLPAAPEMKRKGKGRKRSGTQRLGGKEAVNATQEMGGSATPRIAATRQMGGRHPGDGCVGTQEMGTKYTHQEDTRSTHSVVREVSVLAPPLLTHETLGAHAPDATSELAWGWRGLLNREQWDEYAPEYERVHGEPLRVENTKHFPGPDSYADALSRLRAESPRGDLRKVS